MLTWAHMTHPQGAHGGSQTHKNPHRHSTHTHTGRLTPTQMSDGPTETLEETELRKVQPALSQARPLHSCLRQPIRYSRAETRWSVCQAVGCLDTQLVEFGRLFLLSSH